MLSFIKTARLQLSPAAMDVLRKTRHVLVNPKHWGQNTDQRREVVRTPHGSEEYTVYCIRGAIFASGGGHQLTEIDRAFERVLGWRIVPFNDAKQRKHEEILAVLDHLLVLAASYRPRLRDARGRFTGRPQGAPTTALGAEAPPAHPQPHPLPEPAATAPLG